MKYYIFSFFLSLVSIVNAQNDIPNFDNILDSLGLKGSMVIYDLKSDIYYTNNSTYAQIKYLPASTFKIPNAMIALELGIVEDTNRIFKWNGEKYFVKAWENDMNFKQAFQLSCVPCFKQIAREIGVKRMIKYLKKAKYPSPKINFKNIDNFWLEGDAFINMYEQIAFLKDFYERKIPFKTRTFELMNEIMRHEVENNAYVLKAKTGLVNNNLGWFVGILEADKPYIFALNIQTKSVEFAPVLLEKRKSLTLLFFEQLGFL